MNTVVKIIIGIAAAVMAYLCVMSVFKPQQFDKTQKKREAKIEKRLKEIAEYEQAYKVVYGQFASSDQLVEFLKNGRVYNVIAEGDFTDEMREKGLTEKEAAAKGLIKRDTIFVPAWKKLVEEEKREHKTPEDIVKVPGFEDSFIEIDTDVVEQVIGTDTIHVSVFQAQVPMLVYLRDLDDQIRKEKIYAAKQRNNKNGYPGLRIGSLKELKLTGNWE